MGYQDFWQPYRREVEERFPLMVERLEQIGIEETVAVPFRSYFRHTASFLLNLCRLEEEIYAGAWENKDLQDMSTENQALYKEILPQHYAESYGNPAYATEIGRAHV